MSLRDQTHRATLLIHYDALANDKFYIFILAMPSMLIFISFYIFIYYCLRLYGVYPFFAYSYRMIYVHHVGFMLMLVHLFIFTMHDPISFSLFYLVSDS